MPYKSLLCEVVAVPGGALLKRGLVESRIAGEGVAELCQLLLLLCRTEAASADELLSILLPRMSGLDRAHFDRLLAHLIEIGVIVECADSSTLPQESEDSLSIYISNYAGETGKTLLNESRVAILGISHLSLQLAAALSEGAVGHVKLVHIPELLSSQFDPATDWINQQGVEVSAGFIPIVGKSEIGEANLVVGVSEDGIQAALRPWNSELVRARTPFLPILVNGETAEIGPFVLGNSGPCMECLRARQNSCSDDPANFRAIDYIAPDSAYVRARHPSMGAVAAHLACIQITKFLLRAQHDEQMAAMLRMDFRDMTIRSHRILRIPRCPVCSAGNERPARSILKSPFVPNLEVR